MMTILALDYYRHTDVLHLSQDLLGKYLFTNFDHTLTGGMIVETEAYRGPEDRASHAYGNRRTKRTVVMFQSGGVCYVYLIYGIYCMFNIITNEENIPHGILIRAIEPLFGIDKMLARRGKSKVDSSLTSGPGMVSQALGIQVQHSGFPLDRPPIWLEDRQIKFTEQEIDASPRVGVEYAKEHALLPWRFRIKGNRWTS